MDIARTFAIGKENRYDDEEAEENVRKKKYWSENPMLNMKSNLVVRAHNTTVYFSSFSHSVPRAQCVCVCVMHASSTTQNPTYGKI